LRPHKTIVSPVGKMKNIIQLSGGKDSLALFLKALDLGYKIDEVIYFDVGEWEFEAIHNVIKKAEVLCIEKGIVFTRLEPKVPFPYLAWERSYKQRNGNIKCGYEWCGWHGCRWGTTEKLNALDKYCGDNIQVIGIAYDEQGRLNNEQSKKGNRVFWLNDWEMTEADCLEYCRKKGWDWNNHEPLTGETVDLYTILDRVSCWCCGNKNLKELFGIYTKLPSYWNKLKEYQMKTDKPFKESGSIFELEERFKLGCITKNDLKKYNKNK
jgi:hypothetical protein